MRRVSGPDVPRILAGWQQNDATISLSVTHLRRIYSHMTRLHIKESALTATPIDSPGYVDIETMDRLAALIRDIKQKITDHLQIRDGHHVLDVGCGPGTDTIAMAPLVGSDGLVVGVDYDEGMIKEANARTGLTMMPSRLRHDIADGRSLPFESNTFDACRSERMLQHVIEGEVAVSEIIRVTKPRGRIVIADTDWSTLSIDAQDFDIERRVCRALGSIVTASAH